MKRRGVNIRIANSEYGFEYHSVALRDAIVAAGEEGILSVFPAYNKALDLGLFSFFPAALHLESVISVAASTESDALASFSCFGQSTVDLAAPGVNFTTTSKSPEY